MKKILLGATAAALLASPVLAAPSAEQTVTINGTAPTVCTLAAPTQTNLLGNLTVAGSTVTVTGLFDAADATMDAGSVTLNFAGMCNYAHNVSLKSANGYLYNTTSNVAPLAGTFFRRIGYNAAFNWAGVHRAAAIPAVDSTLAGQAGVAVTSTDAAVSGANIGNLQVSLKFAGSGTTPVVAGNYTDSLTVQIGADL